MIHSSSTSVCRKSCLRGVYLFWVLLSVFFFFSIVKLREGKSGSTPSPGENELTVYLFFDALQRNINRSTLLGESTLAELLQSKSVAVLKGDD